MNNDRNPFDLSDLDTDPMAATSPAPMTAEEIRKAAHVANGGENPQMVCPKCHGRGSRTYGYVNIRTYPCNTCRTTGKVTQKRLDNIDRAKRAAVTAEENKRVARMAFQEEHGALLTFLHKAADWSSFALSLMNSFGERGSLSEKQLAAAYSMMAKSAARDEERKAQRAERAANAPVVDMSAIQALFATATDNAIKRPVFRAEHLEISKAPMNGRNAGALYVKSNGDVYLGKIIDNKFHATRDAGPDTLSQLIAIATDPLAESIKYARRTGRCGCCGRELVNPVSILAGIGPICATKWGLDWRRELAKTEYANMKAEEIKE